MIKLTIDDAGDMFESFHASEDEAMEFFKEVELESHYPLFYTVTKQSSETITTSV